MYIVRATPTRAFSATRARAVHWPFLFALALSGSSVTNFGFRSYGTAVSVAFKTLKMVSKYDLPAGAFTKPGPPSRNDGSGKPGVPARSCRLPALLLNVWADARRWAGVSTGGQR